MLLFSPALVSGPEFTLFNTTGKTKREQEDEILAQEESLLVQYRYMEKRGKWGSPAIITKKISQPVRRDTHWDFLCKEAIWLQDDMKKELNWKKSIASKLAHEAARFVFLKLKEKDVISFAKQLAMHPVAEATTKSHSDSHEKSRTTRKQTIQSHVRSSINKIKIPLTTHQSDMYHEMLKNSSQILSSKNKLEILDQVLKLRMICNAPCMVSAISSPKKKMKIDESLLESCKLNALEGFLKSMQNRNIMVYASSNRMLMHLNTFLTNRGFQILTLNGTFNEMMYAIKSSKNPTIFTASRLGMVTLPSISLNDFIFLDSELNPIIEIEILSKLHQISKLQIHQFMAQDTFEESLTLLNIPIPNTNGDTPTLLHLFENVTKDEIVELLCKLEEENDVYDASIFLQQMIKPTNSWICFNQISTQSLSVQHQTAYFYQSREDVLKQSKLIITEFVKEYYKDIFKKKKKRDEILPAPHGEMPWKKLEEEASLVIAHNLGNHEKDLLNWDLIADNLNMSMYPSATPRTPSQVKQRVDLLNRSPQTTSLPEITQEFHAQNLSKMVGVWQKSGYEPKKILSKGEPLKMENVRNEKSPLDWLKILDKIPNLVNNSNIPSVNKFPPRMQPSSPPHIPFNGTIHDDKKQIVSNSHPISPLVSFLTSLTIKDLGMHDEVMIIFKRNDLSEAEKMDQIKAIVNRKVKNPETEK